MILWHATMHEFREFDPDRSGLGTHFGTKRAAIVRANFIRKRFHREAFLHRYRICVRNPLRIYDVGKWNASWRLAYPIQHADPRIALPVINDSHDPAWKTLFRRAIEEAGYDSIVYENGHEDSGHDSYVIWRADQILSSDTPRSRCR